MSSKFFDGNDVNRSMYKAICSRDLDKISSIIDNVSLSYSPTWDDGFELLLEALQFKHLDVAKLLVEKGCKLTKPEDPKRNSVLRTVVMIGDVPFFRMLFDKIHYCSQAEELEYGTKRPLLHIAAEEGQADIVKILIQSGADVESRDSVGFAPLHLATLRGHAHIIDELISAGANIDSRSSDGKTSLFLAVSSGLKRVVKKLLELESDCNSNSDNGLTPLLVATALGNLDIVQDLLCFGARVNDVNSKKQTPLHIACINKDSKLVAELLNAGADVNAVDCHGMVPCDALIIKISRTSPYHRFFESTTISYLMGRHLTVLRAIGFYLNKKNELFFDTFYRMYCNEIIIGGNVVAHPSDVLSTILSICQFQVKLMKSTKITGSFSYFDIVQKLKDPLGVTSEVEMEFLAREQFQGTFHMYKTIVKSLIQNGRLRNNLLRLSQEYLSVLLISSRNDFPILPEEIRIHVVSFMTNSELETFIKFAETLKIDE